jgi:hypothetical protein
MARKMNIPKAAQIRGIRKALANKKAPRAFIPSLKKRLAKLTACILLAFAASAARAQTPVTIQPSQQILAASGTACTGAPQTFNVANRNQTAHSVTIIPNGAVVTLQAAIFGIDQSGTVIQISDTGYYLSFPGSAVLKASGYYPQIQLQVTCTGGSFGASYSGSSTGDPLNAGTQLQTQTFKPIAQGQAAGANFSSVMYTPFASSGGILMFQYAGGGTGPSGSTLTVTCDSTSLPTIQLPVVSQPLVTSTGPQQFYVPPFPCYLLTVAYTSGGASSALFEVVYQFFPPSAVDAGIGLYDHIASATAQGVRNGGGFLLGINLNTSASGTIGIYDLTPANCTGTPSTNVIATLTIAATENARAIPFNVATQNGICVKASSASIDFTVSYQ